MLGSSSTTRIVAALLMYVCHELLLTCLRAPPEKAAETRTCFRNLARFPPRSFRRGPEPGDAQFLDPIPCRIPSFFLPAPERSRRRFPGDTPAESPVRYRRR